MRPAPETHAAHLLRPVPTNTPRVPIFECSAEDRVDKLTQPQSNSTHPYEEGGRYWVRQGLDSERQLNWQSLQRATAGFIFTIFCPKLCVCYFNQPPPLTQYNYIPYSHVMVRVKMWRCLLKYLAALMWSNQVFLSLVELATSSYNWAPTCKSGLSGQTVFFVVEMI